VHEGDASSYVNCAILTPPDQANSNNVLKEKKAIKTVGRKPLMDTFQFVGIMT
jgi:hypothetical protein